MKYPVSNVILIMLRDNFTVDKVLNFKTNNQLGSEIQVEEEQERVTKTESWTDKIDSQL